MSNDLDFQYCDICRKEIHFLNWEDHEEWHRETWINSDIAREIERRRNENRNKR